MPKKSKSRALARRPSGGMRVRTKYVAVRAPRRKSGLLASAGPIVPKAIGAGAAGIYRAQQAAAGEDAAKTNQDIALAAAGAYFLGSGAIKQAGEGALLACADRYMEQRTANKIAGTSGASGSAGRANVISAVSGK